MNTENLPSAEKARRAARREKNSRHRQFTSGAVCRLIEAKNMFDTPAMWGTSVDGNEGWYHPSRRGWKYIGMKGGMDRAEHADWHKPAEQYMRGSRRHQLCGLLEREFGIRIRR